MHRHTGVRKTTKERVASHRLRERDRTRQLAVSISKLLIGADLEDPEALVHFLKKQAAVKDNPDEEAALIRLALVKLENEQQASCRADSQERLG